MYSSFTRMVPGLKSLKYEERLNCLGLWTLEERRNRADLLEVFKMYKGLSLLPFDHLFTTSSVTTVPQEGILPRLRNIVVNLTSEGISFLSES